MFLAREVHSAHRRTECADALGLRVHDPGVLDRPRTLRRVPDRGLHHRRRAHVHSSGAALLPAQRRSRRSRCLVEKQIGLARTDVSCS